MMSHYFVRLGNWGEILRCRSIGSVDYSRGRRVICRTSRGLEVGEVTATCESIINEASVIVRATTAEDELLISRLEKHRGDAISECRKCLSEMGSKSVLLEVDQVFDAATLVFYFLNPPDADEQRMLEKLAERYETRVRSRHFAKLLADGCGPTCGTKSCGGVGEVERGCGGACAVCVVASGAKTSPMTSSPRSADQ